MTYDYDPPTRTAQASELRAGSVVMESAHHPAVVIRVTRTAPVSVYCLYIWQERRDRPWLLGRFELDDSVEVAVTTAASRASGS